MRMNVLGLRGGVQHATLAPEGSGASFFNWEELVQGGTPASVPMGSSTSGVWLTKFDKHWLIAGQTGSGKTMSALSNAVALCAKTPEHPVMVVIDAKSTMHDLTSELLEAQGYEVMHIDLREADGGCRFNPLLPIWKSNTRGDSLETDALLDTLLGSLRTTVESDRDPFWHNIASNLIAGCILALLEAEEGGREPSLHDVSKVIAAGEAGITKITNSMKNPKGKLLLSGTLASLKAKETAGGIFAVAQTMLGFYDTSLGMNVSGTGGIDIEKILLNARPTAVFLTAPDEAGPGGRSFASLFFNTLYQVYVRCFETGYIRPRRGARIVIDEFPSFPRAQMRELLATTRSRNLFVMAGIQSTAQLIAGGYTTSEVESMVTQFGGCMLFRHSDELLDKLAGLRTGGMLEPGSAVQLSAGEAFVIQGGFPAVRVQMPYFHDLEKRGVFEPGETAALHALAAVGHDIGSPKEPDCITEGRAIGHCFDQIARSVFDKPRPICTKWVEGFCAAVRKKGSYTEMCKRIVELAEREPTLPLGDVRYCGFALAEQFDVILEDSPIEAMLLCRNVSDGEYPLMPGLGDTLYRKMLVALAQSGREADAQTLEKLSESMSLYVTNQAKKTVATVYSSEMERAVPMGLGLKLALSEAEESANDIGPEESHAIAILTRSIDQCKVIVQSAFTRCIGHYTAIAEMSNVGSLLFEENDEASNLKGWVYSIAALCSLCNRTMLSRFKKVLVDGAKAKEALGQTR